MVLPRIVGLRARVICLLVATLFGLFIVPSAVGHADPTTPPTDPTRTVADLQKQMEQATEDYDAARVQLAQSQQREARLRVEAAKQARSVAALQTLVADFADAAYRDGRFNMVSSLLDSGSPQNFLDQMSALDNLSRAQRQQLDQLVSARRTLDQQQRRIDAELAAQRKNAKILSDRKAAIEKDLARWTALASLARSRASRSATRVRSLGHGYGGGTYTGPASGSARIALQTAYAQLGKPYQWGAAGPYSFDCSGLTMYAWGHAGVALPHSSRMQYEVIRHVSRSDLQPGDLVFFGSPIYHVGMYIGGGLMIHAPTTGDVVRIAPVLGDLSGAGRP